MPIRMLLRNSIKMYGAKYLQPVDQEENPVTGKQKIIKKCYLIKCVSRIDESREIVILCQDNTEVIISEQEYYELWRKQSKDLKPYEVHKRYLYFDKFFNENCRPEWCKDSIEELLKPYWLDPVNQPKSKFWEGAAARSGHSYSTLEELDKLSTEDVFI